MVYWYLRKFVITLSRGFYSVLQSNVEQTGERLFQREQLANPEITLKNDNSYMQCKKLVSLYALVSK